MAPKIYDMRICPQNKESDLPRQIAAGHFPQACGRKRNHGALALRAPAEATPWQSDNEGHEYAKAAAAAAAAATGSNRQEQSRSSTSDGGSRSRASLGIGEVISQKLT